MATEKNKKQANIHNYSTKAQTNLTQRVIGFIILLTIALPSLAYDFSQDGIYYSLKGTNRKEVSVTYSKDYAADYSGDLVIPAYVTSSSLHFSGTYKVVEISPDALKYCTKLRSISLPSTIEGVYSKLPINLEGINVDPNNPNIDSRDNSNAIIKTSTNTLVAGCKNTIIPNSVTSIDHDAFYGCIKLSTLEIPSSVTSIGYNAFYGCTGLQSIKIPASVAKIGSSAFYGCTGLVSLELPKSTINIYRTAFAACRSLKHIVIPNSVSGLDECFYRCNKLQSVNINCKSTSKTFNECPHLSEIIIGRDVESIGDETFSPGLNSNITIEDGETALTIGCNHIATSYYQQYQLNDIGMFSGNYIENFYIGRKLNFTTPLFAEYGLIESSISAIGTLTIGEYVNDLGQTVFPSISNAVITKRATPPTIQENAFTSEVYSSIPLKVPMGTLDLYKEAPGWKRFSNISEYDESQIEDPIDGIPVTIKDCEAGHTTISVNTGETARLKFESAENYALNSVTINGIDITDDLDKDGWYTTSSITQPTTVIVSYSDTPLSISQPEKSKTKILGTNGCITVSGLNIGDTINIYGINGAVVGTAIATGNVMSFSLQSNNVYIVKCNGSTFKVGI